jgi:hypothetical protein
MKIETILNLNTAIILVTVLVMFFLRKRKKRTKISSVDFAPAIETDVVYQSKLQTVIENNMKLFFLISVILFLSLWVVALYSVLTTSNKLFFFVSIFGLSFFGIMRFFYSRKISIIVYLLMIVEAVVLLLSGMYHREVDLTAALLFFVSVVALIGSTDKKMLKKEKLSKPTGA